MLADAERKLLRVLYNYSRRHNVIPTMGDLERLTGRNMDSVRESLAELESLNYILWENKASMSSIQIIEGWEREESRPVAPSPSSNVNNNYWMEY
ncbi:hypothetical protein [Paenibacillus glacialis]|uniref:hypothetical protein n=1 Tax=Paenibacillus glacialis TaxID=494026 RepID=UPI0008389EC6|nr:hypothetical protein [Paenibacillus glacialis]